MEFRNDLWIISELKNAGFVLWKYTPPVALLASRVGGAVFNAQEFLAWLKKQLANNATDTAFYHYFELGFLTSAFFAASSTYFVTRFLNLLRRYATEHPEKLHSIHIDDQDLENPELNRPLMQEEKYEEPVQTNISSRTSYMYDCGYLFMQIFVFGYFMGNVGSSANGVDSLEHLTTKWFHFTDTSLCQKDKYYDWIPKSACMFLMCYANGASVLTYNYRRLRDYYPKLITNQGYKKLSFWDITKTLVGSGLTSIIVYKGSEKLQEIWLNQVICHIGNFLPVVIPSVIKKTICTTLAVTNFGTTSLMTCGAILVHKEKQEENQEHPSEFGTCLDKFIKSSIVYNSIITGLALFAFTASLFHADSVMDTSIAYLIIEMTFGLIGVLNSISLDFEGYRVINNDIRFDNEAKRISEEQKNRHETKSEENKTLSITIEKPNYRNWDPRLLKNSTPKPYDYDKDIDGLSTSPCYSPQKTS